MREELLVCSMMPGLDEEKEKIGEEEEGQADQRER